MLQPHWTGGHGNTADTTPPNEMYMHEQVFTNQLSCEYVANVKPSLSMHTQQVRCKVCVCVRGGGGGGGDLED